MRPARGRRFVASVTAVLLALSVCFVTISGTPSSAATSGTAVPSAVHQSGPSTDSHDRAATKKAAAKKKALAKKKAAVKKKALAKKKATAEKKAARKAARKRAARLARIKPHDPSTWIRAVPGHYTPHTGPKFNNPYGGRVKRRALLSHVIRSIESSPGYRLTTDPKTHRRLTCPKDPSNYPSTIRIAVYSLTDSSLANALIAAHRRCVSVQVLMNSHLTAVTSHSWGRIVRVLGKRGDHWQHRRSFARRCSNGCLGTSVMHSKFYLFSHPGATRNTVIVGSSNMTSNATGIQWNDLYTVDGNRTMFRQYQQMFRRMVPDRRATGPYIYRAGKYISTFYPFRRATQKTDRTMATLRTIRCTGATGGSGIKGRTVVYISMHAWFGHRGHYLTTMVRDLYRRGCYVRILYSFMGFGTYSHLLSGTGPRMIVRRALFPGPLGLRASKYSHMKMIAVSGHIGKDRSSWVVWTGSNNWTDRSDHADEVTLRIPSHRVYNLYVRHWKFMNHRRSSAFWAKFEEPSGGGRAP